MHGGSAPQVKRAAQVRLDMAADRAAAVMVRIMEDESLPTADQIRAAAHVLDRAGLRPGLALDVSVTHQTWEHVLDSVLVDVDADIEDAEEVSPGEWATRSSTAALPEPGQPEADLAAERASAKVRRLRQKSANAEAKRRSR
ncbi:hypothetical protein DZF97_00665 [Clavibacter nebraskensis]|uniref:Uncharacterized protein n=2 Tax=Clavibacter nebraskensis TaxID=31963 RepID=A0A399QLW7_9MICO|nr:hypothetical protein DZF97_00665 [Clavibacter nebraskensis]